MREYLDTKHAPEICSDTRATSFFMRLLRDITNKSLRFEKLNHLKRITSIIMSVLTSARYGNRWSLRLIPYSLNLSHDGTIRTYIFRLPRVHLKLDVALPRGRYYAVPSVIYMSSVLDDSRNGLLPALSALAITTKSICGDVHAGISTVHYFARIHSEIRIAHIVLSTLNKLCRYAAYRYLLFSIHGFVNALI